MIACAMMDGGSQRAASRRRGPMQHSCGSLVIESPNGPASRMRRSYTGVSPLCGPGVRPREARLCAPGPGCASKHAVVAVVRRARAVYVAGAKAVAPRVALPAERALCTHAGKCCRLVG
ncbi:hypothetical protein MTO96_002903 [Rhipicephalus appendiculatus]